MGQKVNPVGFRLKINKDWTSTWYADKKKYTEFLHTDLKIRKFIEKRLKSAGVSFIKIDRFPDRANVTIKTSKPGMVIGRDGKEINKLKEDLHSQFGKSIYVNIEQDHKPEVNAKLIAENVATQIEGRLPFRRAMKQSITSTMRGGALGVKIMVSGRLNGAEMARTETYKEGRIPLHTLRANIDFNTATAFTTYGTIGVKVWVYNGVVLSKQDEEEDKYTVKRKTR
jgi:small subunit ribosomal protein S3